MSDFENFIALPNKDAVIASLQKDFADVQVGVQETMAMNGTLIQKSLQDNLKPAPTGTHSAPGSVPFSHEPRETKARHNVFRGMIGGELKKSIRYKILPLMIGEPITLKIYVTGSTFYAHMLEFGTSKMAARPWFYSGIQQLLPGLKNQIEKKINEVVNLKNELSKRRAISSAKGAILKDLRPMIDNKDFYDLRRGTLADMEDWVSDRYAP